MAGKLRTTTRPTRSRLEKQPGSTAMMIGFVSPLPPTPDCASYVMPKERTLSTEESISSVCVDSMSGFTLPRNGGSCIQMATPAQHDTETHWLATVATQTKAPTRTCPLMTTTTTCSSRQPKRWQNFSVPPVHSSNRHLRLSKHLSVPHSALKSSISNAQKTS